MSTEIQKENTKRKATGFFNARRRRTKVDWGSAPFAGFRPSSSSLLLPFSLSAFPPPPSSNMRNCSACRFLHLDADGHIKTAKSCPAKAIEIKKAAILDIIKQNGWKAMEWHIQEKGNNLILIDADEKAVLSAFAHIANLRIVNGITSENTHHILRTH
jgi:hypothetical protein